VLIALLYAGFCTFGVLEIYCCVCEELRGNLNANAVNFNGGDDEERVNVFVLYPALANLR